MNLKKLADTLVVITGGSSGIGFSIAENIAQAGGRLLLVARNPDKLKQAAAALSRTSKHPIEILAADVSRPEDSQRIADKIKTLAPCADLLINSAGIVSAGLLHETPIAEWDRLHAVNVRGLVLTLQALIPDMLEQSKHDKQARHIVNIASAAGFAGVPGMAAYGASKAAVMALSDSLRAELAPYGIGVTIACPDFVQTPIADTIKLFGRMDNDKTSAKVQQAFSDSDLRPEVVADQIIRAVQRNKGICVIGKNGRMGYFLKRLSPALFSNMMNKRSRSYPA